MTIRFSNWMSWATVLLSVGCGAGVVDVGEVAGAAGTDGVGADGADLSGNGSPYLSPNCSIPDLDQYHLLFDSDDGKLERRIYSMRADGAELTPLTTPDELAREPSLSPDGTQLAYTTPEGIQIMGLPGGSPLLFAPNADLSRWTPDGAGVFYRNTISGCYDQKLASNGSQIQLAICLSTPQRAEMTMDGERLVFSHRNEEREGVISTLYSVELSTGLSQILVPQAPISIEHPTLSPDGVWIAASYQCDGNGASSLWVTPSQVPTPACEGRRVTPDAAPKVTNPSWGPGVLIAYERGEPPRDIAIIAADTGEECIIQHPGDDRNPSWGTPAIATPQ